MANCSHIVVKKTQTYYIHMVPKTQAQLRRDITFIFVINLRIFVLDYGQIMLLFIKRSSLSLTTVIPNVSLSKFNGHSYSICRSKDKKQKCSMINLSLMIARSCICTAWGTVLSAFMINSFMQMCLYQLLQDLAINADLCVYQHYLPVFACANFYIYFD